MTGNHVTVLCTAAVFFSCRSRRRWWSLCCLHLASLLRVHSSPSTLSSPIWSKFYRSGYSQSRCANNLSDAPYSPSRSACCHHSLSYLQSGRQPVKASDKYRTIPCSHFKPWICTLCVCVPRFSAGPSRYSESQPEHAEAKHRSR